MKGKVITLTKLTFGQYWVSANISRIDALMSHEIDALVDYHWLLLLASVKAEMQRAAEGDGR